MTNEDKLRGYDIGGGVILAPHRCSDEDEEIHYNIVTPENYLLKIRAIRQFCKELEVEGDRLCNQSWAASHIMCILKYGDGYSHDEALANSDLVLQRRKQKAPKSPPIELVPARRRRWRWW